MYAYRLRIMIPEEPNREIAVQLPDDFPVGPAEVIVLAGSQNRDAFQPTEGSLKELLSFEATPEETEILENFESFRKEHPFRLSSLAEEP